MYVLYLPYTIRILIILMYYRYDYTIRYKVIMSNNNLMTKIYLNNTQNNLIN